MGSGGWTADTYASSCSMKAASGTPDFAYTHDTSSKPVSAWVVHEDLDPKKTNGDGAHKDQNIRESLDSDEHPTSVAIAVLFDETGSMQRVPQLMQKKLPELWGLLLRKGYVEHPQILFGGIGDGFSDRVPLQIAQFESDNRSDEDLEKIFLEGNGGGTHQESYELAMYFMARHTYLDCVEKRGHRGYLFIIGDEAPYEFVDPKQIQDRIGDDVSQKIPTAEIVEELKQKFDVYLIRPAGGSYQRGTGSGDQIISEWRALLGQNVIELDDDSLVSETIALTIGLAEGALGDLDAGLADLREIGSGDAAAAVGKALATVAPGGSMVTSDTPDDMGGSDTIERL